MEIVLARTKQLSNRTNGQLYVNGDFFCFTLEDPVREVVGKPVEEWKVHGETAIPMGRYKVTLENSGRFGPDTITLNHVPGFKYIRIHAGNTEKDTEGCIILGYKLDDNGIISYRTTRPAVADLKRKVQEALRKGEDCWITIILLPK